MSKTPPIKTLDAFFRSDDNVDARVIAYPKLERYADQARQQESQLWQEFMAEEDGSMEEEERARALAMGYLVLTGMQLQTAPERHRSDISDRFSEATVELYGEPEKAEVRRIAIRQIEGFYPLFDMPDVDHNALLRTLIYLNDQVGFYSRETVESESDSYEQMNAKIAEAFTRRFGGALEVFDKLDPSIESLSPEQLKACFEQAKSVLAESDPDWDNYGFDFSEKKSCEYDKDSRQVLIGRLDEYKTNRAKRLFIEEVLVHMQRAKNGAKTGDYLMEAGLPGIGDAEEGLAKVFQVAMGEPLGERSEDFYMDTAFALGSLGKPKLSRPELVGRYVDRMTIRHQAKGEQFDRAKLVHNAWRYANRIYRGSLGNHHVGVNTKDISYYLGYLKIREFTKSHLDAGLDPDKLLDYLLLGRFDPTKQDHADHARRFLGGHELIDETT